MNNRHSENNDWSTPEWLFTALDDRIEFGIDACAGERDRRCHRFLSDEFEAAIALADGSLSGLAIWCNPPYGSRMGWWIDWCARATHGGQARCVFCLVPVRTSVAWWHDCIPQSRRVCFVRGRLRFGGSNASAPFDSALVVFGTEPFIESVCALRGKERVIFTA